MTERQKLLIDTIEREIVWALQHPSEHSEHDIQVANADLKKAKDPNSTKWQIAHLCGVYAVT